MVKNSNNLQKGSIWGYLTLLLPISLTAVASFESGGMFWAIAATAGMGWAYKLYQQHQKHQLAHLDSVFYRLIKENKGRVTALDLAMNAKLPGSKVQEYLDERASEFAADFEVTEQGGILYYFQVAPNINQAETIPVKIAVTAPEINQKQVSNKNPELFPITQKNSVANPKISFTQTELSRRFKVHATTIGKWKVKPEFGDWSREKDPDAIAWEYSTENKRFYPKD
ncbi:MAG: hypothetical protein EAZ09_04310 [Oscillatoriales cyanobacterium]|nr:MAG: hypothetical protein EAZ18_00510 [Oscillatoriales cyanobacterium]TAH24347.1 MAG: hypothetical protein EAZ09_04310 [Oscillatoriales cyanobacterium]